MKLTNTIRDTIIRAIMDDTPFDDYDEIAKQEVQAFIDSQLPAKALELIKEFPWVTRTVIYSPQYLPVLHSF